MVGDSDVIGLSLEGLQVFLALAASLDVPQQLWSFVALFFRLRLGVAIVSLCRGLGEIQSLEHFWGYAADIGVGVADVVSQHAVVLQVGLQAGAQPLCSRALWRLFSLAAALGLPARLLACIAVALGRGRGQGRRFLEGGLCVERMGRSPGEWVAGVGGVVEGDGGFWRLMVSELWV